MATLGISELVLVVNDVAKACEFYHDIVGLRLEKDPSDTWAWFLVDSGNPPQRFALTKGPLLYEEHSRLPEGKRFGPVHFAFRVEPNSIEAMVQRLRDNNVEVFGPTRLEWMNATSYYFYDLDNNMAEFTAVDIEE